MNSFPKRLALVLLSVLALAFATGCQTSRGFGTDVEKLGDKIQDKAN